MTIMITRWEIENFKDNGGEQLVGGRAMLPHDPKDLKRMLASTLALLAHAAVPMSFDALPAGPLQDAQCNMETVDAAKYALAASCGNFFAIHACSPFSCACARSSQQLQFDTQNSTPALSQPPPTGVRAAVWPPVAARAPVWPRNFQPPHQLIHRPPNRA